MPLDYTAENIARQAGFVMLERDGGLQSYNNLYLSFFVVYNAQHNTNALTWVTKCFDPFFLHT